MTNLFCVLPSSACDRNLRAEISANVTPPKKKTRVTFCSPVPEWVEVMELPTNL